MAVVEHPLIPARVRSEWARLRCRKMASIWAPASQEASHVGHSGVGIVSMRGAPLSLPSAATVQIQRFFVCCRAVRCVLPLGGGRVMHLVVLYGYQGADRDPERLALTDQLLDAALGELACVAREQPCLLVGDFNVEPTKIHCLAKGIMAGLWVDLEASWAFASGRVREVTCRQDWVSGCEVMQGSLGCASFCCSYVFLTILGGWRRFLCLFSVLLCGWRLGYRFLTRVGGPRLLRFRGFGIFMMIGSSLCLGMML